MKRQLTGTEPSGAYSPGIIGAGRHLYVSGQGPERDGEPILSTTVLPS